MVLKSLENFFEFCRLQSLISDVTIRIFDNNSAQIFNILFSPIVILENNQITTPAGIAIKMALLRIWSVLSSKDLTNTCFIWGFLYGGNSNIKFDGTPFKSVLDNNFEIIRHVATRNNAYFIFFLYK